jgi:cyclopropane fatty-acyl-phospholipid synthase-like methyltransferase
MEKQDTSIVLHGIADRMRLQAAETFQPHYKDMLNRTANSLDDEANRLTEMQTQEFCVQLNKFSASLILRN